MLKPIRYLKRHGLTLADYDEMFRLQDGRCAICRCGSSKRLHVDHNHETGLVRGLLCYLCNTMLGNSKDQPGILEAAASYLRFHDAESWTVAQADSERPSGKQEVPAGDAPQSENGQRASERIN